MSPLSTMKSITNKLKTKDSGLVYNSFKQGVETKSYTSNDDSECTFVPDIGRDKAKKGKKNKIWKHLYDKHTESSVMKSPALPQKKKTVSRSPKISKQSEYYYNTL